MPPLKPKKIADRLALLSKSQRLGLRRSPIEDVIDVASSPESKAVLKALVSIDTKLDTSIDNQSVLGQGHDELAGCVEEIQTDIGLIKKGNEETSSTLTTLSETVVNNSDKIEVLEKWVEKKSSEEIKIEKEKAHSAGYQKGVMITVGKVAAALAVAATTVISILKFVIDHYFPSR